jgi:diguanylate cyclase (GGDEF)-like protein
VPTTADPTLAALPPIDDLLAQADAARAAGDLARGLAAAERAYGLALVVDVSRRARAGHLWIHFLFRTGALAAVVEHGLQVLPDVRRDGHDGRSFEVLRWVTLAACDAGQFETALECAREFHQLAVSVGDKGTQSLALNALGCCFERMGDPWQGERLLLDALALAREHGQPHELFAALNNLGAVLIGKFYLLRDAVSALEAREPLTRGLPHVLEALAAARQLPDPFPQVFIEGNVGEILLHLGRFDEAQGHLYNALDAAQRGGFRAQVWRIQCSIGELQLGRGDAAAAWQTLGEALAASAGGDPRATQLRLHHALASAARALGRPADALPHMDRYLRLERERSVKQLHAQSQLFITRVEAEQVRLDAQRQRVRAAALEADARRDQLTQVGNRREVEHRLPELLAAAQDGARPLAMAMLDIDHFKGVNDRFGHAVGDDVLIALGQLLREGTRGLDLVARLGGEEFLIVLPDADAARALDACERLRARIDAHPWGALAPGLRVSVSIGVASAPPYDARLLGARADTALYRAKAQGRNCVVMV